MGYSRRGGGCQPLGELTLTGNCASLARRREKNTSGTGRVFRTGVRTPFLMIASSMFFVGLGARDFHPKLRSRSSSAASTTSTLDGITSLTVNMKAFLISAAQRYMEEVASLPHVCSPYLTEDFALKGSEGPGLQASTASSHLMKVLFAARLCRPDLLVGITRLASKVSCWQLALS